MRHVMIGNCSKAGRDLKVKSSSKAGRTLATTCKAKKSGSSTIVKKQSKVEVKKPTPTPGSKLTKAQEFWIERMGTKQYPLTEPTGSLWRARGKKIYVEKKRNDTSAYRIIKSLNWVDNVQEAGATAILVTLK